MNNQEKVSKGLEEACEKYLKSMEYHGEQGAFMYLCSYKSAFEAGWVAAFEKECTE